MSAYLDETRHQRAQSPFHSLEASALMIFIPLSRAWPHHQDMNRNTGTYTSYCGLKEPSFLWSITLAVGPGTQRYQPRMYGGT
jgi:hypothetical protein